MADGSLAACTSYSGFNALVVEEGWEEIIKNQVYLHHSGTAASPIEYRRGLGPSSVLVCVYDICLPFVTRPSFLPTALTRPLGVPTAEQARGRAPLMPFQHQQWAVSRKPPLWVWSVAWEHFVGYWFPATDDCALKDVWHIWSHVWFPEVDRQGLMIINDQQCLMRRCCVGSLPRPKRTDAQVKVVKMMV